MSSSSPIAERQSSNKSDKWELSTSQFLILTNTIAFCAFTLAGILKHEMWNDECQAWLIARDSTSILDLLQNVRYEGSGPLWHLLLYPLAQINHNPISMQILHVILATACVYLVTRYAPFAWYQKFLFSFGYFIFFEYALISRSYVLGNLFLFAFCAVYQRANKNYLALSGLLALLAATSVYGAIIAGALALGLFVDWLLVSKTDFWLRYKKRFLASLVLFLVALSACVLFLVPPSDGYLSNWQTNIRQRVMVERPEDAKQLMRAAGEVLYAYAPIPSEPYRFWESSFFRTDFVTLPAHWAAVSIALFLAFALSLRRFPFAAIGYGLATTTLVAFSYLVFTGAMRHFGQLFTLLVACLWIAGNCNQIGTLKRPYPFNRGTSFGGILFTSLLVIQFLVGTYCYYIDYLNPFSASAAMANYMRATGSDKRVIYAANSFDGVSVCALLDRKVIQADRATEGSFWRGRDWVTPKRNYLSQLLEKSNTKEDVLLVVRHRLPEYWRINLKIRFLKKFTGAIVDTEARYLYVMSPQGRSAEERLKSK